jgi:hypothetical protein
MFKLEQKKCEAEALLEIAAAIQEGAAEVVQDVQAKSFVSLQWRLVHVEIRYDGMQLVVTHTRAPAITSEEVSGPVFYHASPWILTCTCNDAKPPTEAAAELVSDFFSLEPSYISCFKFDEVGSAPSKVMLEKADPRLPGLRGMRALFVVRIT